MIWKDGTKMDNGICIQTMPTQNYFTFSMEHIIDTQDFISAFSKKDQGAKPWPNFWGKLDLGITSSTGVVPCSERPSFGLKIASKFYPNWVLAIFTLSKIMTSLEDNKMTSSAYRTFLDNNMTSLEDNNVFMEKVVVIFHTSVVAEKIFRCE